MLGPIAILGLIAFLTGLCKAGQALYRRYDRRLARIIAEALGEHRD